MRDSTLHATLPFSSIQRFQQLVDMEEEDDDFYGGPAPAAQHGDFGQFDDDMEPKMEMNEDQDEEEEEEDSDDVWLSCANARRASR